MTTEDEWTDVGAADELCRRPLQQVLVGGRTRVALSWVGGRFAAVSGVCNHVGGPLGEGRLEGEYIVCPWHYWKFHHRTGAGEPGFEADRVPAHEVKVEAGRVLVSTRPTTTRSKKPHAPHPLARPVERGDGPVRVLGLSTTAMTAGQPRYSTSDDLLDTALAAAGAQGCET
ncbi:MAG: Rieske 2Fe-2S domain-containing protein, partial [Myxococcaceae bacterium]|nr:Rieske 2Fe-2S domain-containing protein [Myxococcaceae bacterium]